MPPPVTPRITPAMHLSPTFRGPSLVLCWFLCCQYGVSEFPLAQVSWFSGNAYHGLGPFAHIITPPSTRLHFVSSAQDFTVDLCICLYQLIDEGSMMTIKVVINLIIGEGQFRYPLHHCLKMAILPKAIY